MAKIKGDVQIGYRAFEEIKRLYPSIKTAIIRTRCSKTSIYAWRDGQVPDGFNLAKLHYGGADVIYILTGKRSEG